MGFTSFVANEGNIVSLGLFYGKYPVLENQITLVYISALYHDDV